QNVQNRPAILSKPLAYNAERSSHMISPTHVYAKTQELQERRSGSNSLMTSNGRMEIFGPPDQLNGPKISAIESLKKVKASICTATCDKGYKEKNLTTLNGIGDSKE